MGWSVGFVNNRWIGYGVPAVCDHPGCGEDIDRGLSYRCGEYGTDEGCGLFFCDDHLRWAPACRLCERCDADEPPFDPTPDTTEWLLHQETDESWAEWRAENPNRPQVTQ